ncbi:MAG: hypothetical protein IH960_10400 [Chloroflexi bacterium]|nr:hypothetical protein [Chloroflexota bacterium]
MTERAMLDRVYQLINQRFIDTGSAPHYTDLAAELAIPPEAGRQLLHELMDAGITGMWLHPGTDHIASFGPFNNLPTQYRITIEGEQKWWGQ